MEARRRPGNNNSNSRWPTDRTSALLSNLEPTWNQREGIREAPLDPISVQIRDLWGSGSGLPGLNVFRRFGYEVRQALAQRCGGDLVELLLHFVRFQGHFEIGDVAFQRGGSECGLQFLEGLGAGGFSNSKATSLVRRSAMETVTEYRFAPSGPPCPMAQNSLSVWLSMADSVAMRWVA